MSHARRGWRVLAGSAAFALSLAVGSVAAAVAIGTNVGRWWLSRRGSVAAALGVGVLATGLGLAGGPVARATLAVLAAATDVLSAESALARIDPP